MPGAPFARTHWWPAVLVGLAVVVLLPGCSRGSFLGDRYNNFRAYYNTFYNAKRSFEQGEEQRTNVNQRVDRDRYLSVFTDQPSTAAGARPGQGGPFQDAIDKGADLLRERPDSKWADDALLLIGKAYFYQGNYVGAEGKFRETEVAAEERGQQELLDEARFWLGRTLAASERYEEATLVLQNALAREGLRRYWKARLQLAIADLFVQQRQWDEAANALTEALPDVRDGDLAGRAQFLLGQVLEASGRYEAAAEAYDGVRRFRPVYELGYAAQLSRALVLGLDAGQPETAVALIRRMRSDDKNFQNRAEVEIAYARLLAAGGQVEDARERFEELLYGEEFRGNTYRGTTYYRYAEFYRDVLNDYTTAAAYYDSAATSLRNEPGREELYTRTALVGVRRRADVYRAYATLAHELAAADSLLYLGSLDEADFRDAIAAIEAERLRAWQEEQRRLNQRRADAGFGDVPVAGDGGIPFDPGEGRSGGGVPVDVGFLNYRDPARVQDALIAFQRIWGDRPLVPNWRRREAITGAVLAEQNDLGATGDIGNTAQRTGGPPPLDLANVPRSLEAQLDLRASRAQVRYELGNVLFLSLAEPDSAAYWYNRVVEEDGDQPVALRALYALAEVRHAQDRTTEAQALYRQIIDADPESALADAARERLGLPPRPVEVRADETSEASRAYDEAYSQWLAGAYRSALGAFLRTAAAYPDTDTAPRALFAASHVFLDWAHRDTLDIEAAFPADLVPPVFLDAAEAEPAFPEAPVEEEGGGEPLGDERGTPDVLGEVAILEELDALAVETPPAPAPVPASAEPPAEEAPADTLAQDVPTLDAPVLPDPVPQTAAFDSLGVADSTAALPVRPGLPVPVDSLTAADSLAVPRPPAFGLADLYALIERTYPTTPYATEATRLLAALSADEEPVASVQEPAEAEAADDLPDTAHVLGDDAQPGAALPAEFVEAAPPGTFGLLGERPLNTEIGGYSWRVASLPSPLAARALLRNFERRGIRAGVTLESGDAGEVYVILLGQFTSTDDAVAARSELPTTGIGRDIRIVDIYGLDLLGPSALEPQVAD